MDIAEINHTLEGLDSRVDEIEKQLPVINERYNNINDLFQKNIVVLDKLESSFQDNRLAMQALTLSIEQSNQEITGIKDDISSLKEERSLNLMKWLKNNFINIFIFRLSYKINIINILSKINIFKIFISFFMKSK